MPERRLDAWIVVVVPASKPARAAPAMRAFFDFVIFPNYLLSELDCNHTCLYYVATTRFGLLGAVDLDWVGSKPRQ